jgi:transcriptional regulator with XRE-family HTH domain
VDGLGARFPRCRDSLGWNQTELAYRAGVTQSKASNIGNEGKHGGIYAGTLKDLAIAVGASTDCLLGLTDDPTPRNMS